MVDCVIAPAPVKKSITVAAPPARAFEVFTAGFDRWWPRTHSNGASPLKTAVLEPRAGGRWYGVGEDGSEDDWGDVLVWAPPTRLLLAWRIGVHRSAQIRLDEWSATIAHPVRVWCDLHSEERGSEFATQLWRTLGDAK